MTSLYKIGTTTGNKVTLDTLVDRDPQPAPAHYAEYIPLGDGTIRGAGYLMAEWRWKLIDLTDIAALRTYCSGVSAAVYITTPDTDGVWNGYSATMIWPHIPDFMHGEWLEDFAIQFTELVDAGGTT